MGKAIPSQRSTFRIGKEVHCYKLEVNQIPSVLDFFFVHTLRHTKTDHIAPSRLHRRGKKTVSRVD